jgi:hypothetical protein
VCVMTALYNRSVSKMKRYFLRSYWLRSQAIRLTRTRCKATVTISVLRRRRHPRVLCTSTNGVHCEWLPMRPSFVHR